MKSFPSEKTIYGSKNMLSFNKKTAKLQKENLAYIEEGKGEKVILVHGNMSSGAHFLPLIDLLKSKFTLLAPDLRGFGDSSYNNRFDSMDQLAEDLNEFMEVLNIPSAHFVCWSAGCPVTLKLAAMYPQKVKSIFAIEGGSHKGYPIYKKDKNFQSVFGSPYKSKEEMAQDPVQVTPALNMIKTKNAAGMSQIWDAVIYTCKKPSKEDNAQYIAETLKQRCLIDLDWALANLNMSHEYNAYGKGSADIKKVNCPVAFTTADKDLSVPPWMVMENVNAFPAARLIAYVDCGHSPLIDCPQQLAQDVVSFIENK